MSELLMLQRALQAHLLRPDTEADPLAALIADSAAVPRARRLHIYANAYRVRMVEALTADFSALRGYLGDDEFETLAGRYIDAQPSRQFSLRWVGHALEDFLRTQPPYAEHPELAELARFEWALCHAFDAADAAPLAPAALSALTPAQWPQLRLAFVPAHAVIALRGNAPLLWQALNRDEVPPAVEWFADDRYWLVWRRELTLLFRPLDDIELIAFERFRDGADFAEVCAALADRLPEAEIPARAAGLLQRWLQDELVAAP